jgi:transcriptional regulator with XRE-family HTH domain
MSKTGSVEAVDRPRWRLRRERVRRGWSYATAVERIAAAAHARGFPPELLDLDESQLKRWENGKTTPRKLSIWLLAETYGLSPVQLDLPPLPQTAGATVTPPPSPNALIRRPQDSAATLHAHETAPGRAESLTLEWEDMERRGFLTLVASILARASAEPLAPDGWERLSDAAAIEPVAQVIPQYRRLDGRVPSAQLLGPVRSQLYLAAHLTHEASSPWARCQLARSVSEAASFAAWLLIDADNIDAAREHYRLSVRFADVAGDPLLRAYQLGSLVSLAVDVGASNEALALYRHLADRVPTAAPTTAHAWLASLEATANAVAGHEHRAMTALDSAAASIERGSGETAWPWLYPFDMAKLVAARAQCQLLLHRWQPALDLLESALSSSGVSIRKRGDLLIWYATAYARTEEPEAACGVAHRALDLANQTRSRQLFRRVETLRQQLHRWADTPAVEQLDERIHTVGL